MTQLAIPVPVRPEDVARIKTMGQSIIHCATLGGLEPKELAYELNSDRGQVSRWQNDQEGITWKKLRTIMECCGNDAPVLWMADQLGYDLHSFRHKESDLERELREAKEETARYKAELATLTKYVQPLKGDNAA